MYTSQRLINKTLGKSLNIPPLSYVCTYPYIFHNYIIELEQCFRTLGSPAFANIHRNGSHWRLAWGTVQQSEHTNFKVACKVPFKEDVLQSMEVSSHYIHSLRALLPFSAHLSRLP